MPKNTEEVVEEQVVEEAEAVEDTAEVEEVVEEEVAKESKAKKAKKTSAIRFINPVPGNVWVPAVGRVVKFKKVTTQVKDKEVVTWECVSEDEVVIKALKDMGYKTK